MIVIPAIDLSEGRVVRLTQGDPNRETRYGEDPVAAARRFEREGASILHVVDLDAALGSGANRVAIEAVCSAVDIPVQVGGGLRTLQAIEDAIGVGAARAIVGSAAVFGAAHLEPLQFPALFVFGLVAAVLATRSGRLGPGIWAHVAFNAVAVANLQF